MELSMHDLSALYSILKAHKGPNVGAVITGHAVHVLNTMLQVRMAGGNNRLDLLPSIIGRLPAAVLHVVGLISSAILTGQRMPQHLDLDDSL